MTEKESTEYEFSPWEISVSNAYHAYLLAQARMESELEFLGENHPIYHPVDKQIRSIFEEVVLDSRVRGFMPEVFKLPARETRASANGRFAIESPYAGLFPSLGGKQSDGVWRFWFPFTNEVLRVGMWSDSKYIPDLFLDSNNDFIGLETIRNSDIPNYVRIIKVGEGEEYGPLTIAEIRSVIFALSHGYYRDIETLIEQRLKMKEEARQSNGNNLKNRVFALNTTISERVRFRNAFYRINVQFGLGDYDGTQIDADDQISYEDANKWPDYRFWFSPGQRKLLIAPYKSEPYQGLAGVLTRLVYRQQRFLPNKVTLNTVESIESPDRYWCKTGPIIAEDLMRTLPQKSAEKIRAVYGNIANLII